jgi:hypothetical protein
MVPTLSTFQANAISSTMLSLAYISGAENTASKPSGAPIFCVISPSIYCLTHKIL